MESAVRIASMLRAVRRRLALRRAIAWAVRAGWIGAAVAAGLLGAGLLVPAAAVRVPALVLVAPLAGAAAAALALARRPGLRDCAIWIDRACGLDERAATAYEEMERGAAKAGASFQSALLADALAALRGADLERVSRLAAPREMPLLAAASAAFAILFIVPGEPQAGARPVRAEVSIREAARPLASALRRAGETPAGLDPLEKAMRGTMKDLDDGAISAAEAKERLRELARLLQSARAAPAPGTREPGAAERARWLDLLIDAVGAADALAGEAAGAGGAAAPAQGGGTTEARARAIEELISRGAAHVPGRRAGGPLRDFPSASPPPPPSAAYAPTAATAAPPADLERLLAAPRRALAERRWPRWKYDDVVDRYFGIAEPR